MDRPGGQLLCHGPRCFAFLNTDRALERGACPHSPEQARVQLEQRPPPWEPKRLADVLRVCPGRSPSTGRYFFGVIRSAPRTWRASELVIVGGKLLPTRPDASPR
ncbi:MAG: hypothetical protein EHM78_02965 [Myxococcaceae bacterium]|nr:MAG: hypothetical protein EHM78_02965 [Myxococcaceae bacterium]